MFSIFRKTFSSANNGEVTGTHVPLGTRLNNSRTLNALLYILLIGILQVMGYYSPHWGPSLDDCLLPEGFLLLCVILALIPMYLFCAGKLGSKNKTFLVTWIPILIQLLLFGLIRNISTGTYNELLYLPYILAPMVVTSLMGSRMGMFSTIAVCMLGCFFIMPEASEPVRQVQFWVLSSLSGMLIVLMTNNLRTRARLLSAGAGAGFLIMTLSIITGIIRFQNCISWDTAELVSILLSFGVSLLIGVLMNGVFPWIEKICRITTPIGWMEYADMNRPLLRRFQLEAPGSHQHCQMVAQLAEAAAEAIGANSDACRVGAYYHDIGKVENPLYFIENVRDGLPNLHDGLSPKISAQKIMKHVDDGVHLAKADGLPHEVIDAIRQHHGKSLVYLFYRAEVAHQEELLEKEAQGTVTTDEKPSTIVNEADFRYKGPIPQTRESAIISLADVVESATRSMGITTLEEIKSKVEQLLKQRVIDGHLDDSGLSFGDLKKISKSFMKTLESINHSRIKYPEADKEIDKSKSSPLLPSVITASSPNNGETSQQAGSSTPETHDAQVVTSEATSFTVLPPGK